MTTLLEHLTLIIYDKATFPDQPKTMELFKKTVRRLTDLEDCRARVNNLCLNKSFPEDGAGAQCVLSIDILEALITPDRDDE